MIVPQFAGCLRMQKLLRTSLAALLLGLSVHIAHASIVKISVKDHAAVGDCIADDTASVNAAIAAAGSNATIYFPPGCYKITDTIAVRNDRVHIVGDGAFTSELWFVPSGNKTLLELKKAGNAVLFQGSVRNLSFRSDNSSFTKIAIDLVDTSGYALENLVFNGDHPIPGIGWMWSGGIGGDSIGLRVRGREFGLVSNLYNYSDRPLVVADNPNDTIDIDHFHFRDLYLTANGHPNVTIESGVNLSNVTFDGAQAWVKGTTGLSWVDTTSQQASFNLKIANVRTENGQNPNAFSFDIRHNYELQGLAITNSYLEQGRNGYRLRKVNDAELSSSFFIGGAGKISIDADGSNDRLSLRKMRWASYSTSAIGGLRQIFATPLLFVGVPPPDAFYEKATNGQGNVTFGGALGNQPFTVQNGGSAPIGTASSGGFVFIEDSEGLGALYYLSKQNFTPYEIADPRAVYTASPGASGYSNIFYSNGAWAIQNLRGGPRTYRILFIGTNTSL